MKVAVFVSKRGEPAARAAAAQVCEQWCAELGHDVVATVHGADDDHRQCEQRWELVKQAERGQLDAIVTFDESTWSNGWPLPDRSIQGWLHEAGKSLVLVAEQP